MIQGHIISRLKDQSCNTLLAVAFALIFAAPLMLFLINDISLVGMGEESVGYRYFYSLRIVYEKARAPFLPQGHLMTVLHCLLQTILTAIGYPVTDIVTRPNVFSYSAALIPIVLIGFAFYWATKPIKTYFFKIAFALLFVTTAFHLRNGAGYHLLIPDYYIWSLPLVLFTFGFVARELHEPGYLYKNWFYFALLTACAFTMKVTYLLAPMLIGAFALKNLNFRQFSVLLFKCAVTSLAFSILILSVYHRFKFGEVLMHFRPDGYLSFVESSHAYYKDWYFDTLYSYRIDATSLVVLMPFVLFLSLLLRKNNYNTLILFLAAAISSYVAFKRPYPPTMVESANFAVMLLCIWLFTIQRTYEYMREVASLTAVKVGLYISVIFLFFISIQEFNNLVNIYKPKYQQSQFIEQSLREYTAGAQGKVLYIVLNNDYRPITVESALYKGGLNMSNNINWSNLVRGFIPNKKFLIHYFNPTLNKYDFEKIIYVAPKDKEYYMAHKLQIMFGVPFEAYDCNFVIDQGIGGVNWFLPYVEKNIKTNSRYLPKDGAVPRTIVGCTRKQIDLAKNEQ